MTVGTKSLLFGVHQFAVHPWFVAWAWWRLYGFPIDPRLWVAFIVHDWGYWGCPNMDGPEGEEHPRLGANIMRRLFGQAWWEFCYCHSRFLSKRECKQFSRLCVADKLAIALTPSWIYIPAAILSGELSEYMSGQGARTPAGDRSPLEWHRAVRAYCAAWAKEHRGGAEDTWTGTRRDLEMIGKR